MVSSDDDCNLSLCFFDSDFIAKKSLKTARSKSGSCFIELSLLYRALSSLVSEEGTTAYFSSTGQNLTVKIKTKVGGKTVRHKRVLQLFDASDKNQREVDNKESIVIDRKLLWECFKKITVSVPNFYDKEDFSGVLIACADNTLKMVSFNGISLTEYTIQVCGIQDFTCVIPGRNVSKVSRFLSRAVDENVLVSLSKDDASITVSADNTVITFPVSKEKFTDYSKISSGYSNCATIDTKIFLENIKNLGFALSKEDKFRVSVRLFNGVLTLSSNSSDNDEIDIDGFSGEFHIDFNAYILESIVKNIHAEHFDMMFKSSNSPVLITPTGDVGFSLISLVAPLQ
jgi:DNA polymerase III sliding clamp (beta) subunit (PCNA family)